MRKVLLFTLGLLLLGVTLYGADTYKTKYNAWTGKSDWINSSIDNGGGWLSDGSTKTTTNYSVGIGTTNPTTQLHMTGAITSADFPAIGADPDVATAGYIGRDNNNHWLRGFDGTIQFVYGGKAKVICGTATNPDLLTEADFLPAWDNFTGASFVIDNIYAVSDVDNAVFTLKYTTNGYTDHTNLTTIEAITISTDGTGIYYYTIAYADIDNATIPTGTTVGYDAGATDCDFIHFAIEGHLLGDVN